MPKTAEELKKLTEEEYNITVLRTEDDIDYYVSNEEYKNFATFISEVFSVSGDPKESPEVRAIYNFFEYLAKPDEENSREISEKKLRIILALNKALMQQRAVAQVSTGRTIRVWEKRVKDGEFPELAEFADTKEKRHSAAKDLALANEGVGKLLVGNHGAYESLCSHMTGLTSDGRKVTDLMGDEAQYIKEDAKRRYLQQKKVSEKDYQQFTADTESVAPTLLYAGFEVKKNRTEGSYFSKVPKSVEDVIGKNDDQLIAADKELTDKLSSVIDYNNSVIGMAAEAVLLTNEIGELNALTGNDGRLNDMKNAVLAVSRLGKNYFDKELGKNTSVIKAVYAEEALEKLRVSAENYARLYKRDKTPVGKKNLEFAVRMQNFVITSKERLSRLSGWADEPDYKLRDIKTVTDELTEKLNRISNEKNRRGLEKDLSGTLRKRFVRTVSVQGFEDVIVRGNRAKEGVWGGSKAYDDALDSFAEVETAYSTLQALNADPTATAEQKLNAIQNVRDAVTTAETGIEAYFERKRSQNMMQTGATYDLKSQRRIDVMKDAKSYLEECKSTMNLEEQQVALSLISMGKDTKEEKKPDKPEKASEANSVQTKMREHGEKTQGQYSMVAKKALVSIQHLGAMTIAEEKGAELTQNERDEAGLHIASVIYYELAFDGIKIKDAQSTKTDKTYYTEQIETIRHSPAFTQVTKDLDRETIAEIAADPRKITKAYKDAVTELGLKKKDSLDVNAPFDRKKFSRSFG